MNKNINLNEAIILALVSLGEECSIQEIREWIEKRYPNTWKDVSTALADMVPVSFGGNSSSTTQEEYRILERVSRGYYRLIK
ncbi:hypothetical protein V7122_22260 [Bacillus sp. JJ1532]|uniref:hypothetical protein n=1 Tax=Bacillus sp. JJ1532 TaxID=3122958 RepID=UPI002FFF55DB